MFSKLKMLAFRIFNSTVIALTIIGQIGLTDLARAASCDTGNYAGFSLGPDNKTTYAVTLQPLAWQDAQALAQTSGGRLVVVTSQQQNDAIASNLGSYFTAAPSPSSGNKAWIGLDDPTNTAVWCMEGQTCSPMPQRFSWANGFSAFTNYSSGQPDGFCTNAERSINPDGNCYGEPWVAMSSSGKWSDEGDHGTTPITLKGIVEWPNQTLDCTQVVTPPVVPPVQTLPDNGSGTLWCTNSTQSNMVQCQQATDGSQLCPLEQVECSAACPAGFGLNTTTDQCEAPPSCPSGATLDATTNKCRQLIQPPMVVPANAPPGGTYTFSVPAGQTPVCVQTDPGCSLATDGDAAYGIPAGNYGYIDTTNGWWPQWVACNQPLSAGGNNYSCVQNALQYDDYGNPYYSPVLGTAGLLNGTPVNTIGCTKDYGTTVPPLWVPGGGYPWDYLGQWWNTNASDALCGDVSPFVAESAMFEISCGGGTSINTVSMGHGATLNPGINNVGPFPDGTYTMDRCVNNNADWGWAYWYVSSVPVPVCPPWATANTDATGNITSCTYPAAKAPIVSGGSCTTGTLTNGVCVTPKIAPICPSSATAPCVTLQGNTSGTLYCSPNQCQSTTQGWTSTNDTTTGANDKTNTGPRAQDGTCLGQIYLFNGNDMRCRLYDRYGMLNSYAKLVAQIALAATGAGAALAAAMGVSGAMATAVINAAVQIATNASIDGATGQFNGTSTLIQAGTSLIAAGAAGYMSGSTPSMFDYNPYGSTTLTLTDSGFTSTLNDSLSSLGNPFQLSSYGQSVLNQTQFQQFMSQITSVVNQYSPAINQSMLGNYSETRCCYPDKMSGSCEQNEFKEASLAGNGACHVVGTYCASTLLSICMTSKQTSCCFSSKLARIIQEQGRPQLTTFGPDGGWGTPRSPNCRGFTPSEFQSIDMSQIDFSEYIADLNAKIQKITPMLQQQISNVGQQTGTILPAANSPSAQ